MLPALAAFVLVAALAALLAWWLWRRPREGFATQRAIDVCEASRGLFTPNDAQVSYAAFKAAVPGPDPVLFHDTRALWRAKGPQGYTPEAVQRVL